MRCRGLATEEKGIITPTWSTTDALHTVPSKLHQRRRQLVLRSTVSALLSSFATTFFQKLLVNGGIERDFRGQIEPCPFPTLQPGNNDPLSKLTSHITRFR
ncbi:hypothetical protein PIB30_052466 [Stylosanthes scabra]|uniref:Uncharacterized protein n=1 Tax=Stylosanthes scabra TaxID=79078 RepID=A0ABU6ZH09_9FABA|nr:hypothetical protein [Stylosanthes scabra]